MEDWVGLAAGTGGRDSGTCGRLALGEEFSLWETILSDFSHGLWRIRLLQVMAGEPLDLESGLVGS